MRIASRPLATLNFAVETTRPEEDAKLAFETIIAKGQDSILERKRFVSTPVVRHARLGMNRLQCEGHLALDLTVSDDDEEGEGGHEGQGDTLKPDVGSTNDETCSIASLRTGPVQQSFTADSRSFQTLQRKSRRASTLSSHPTPDAAGATTGGNAFIAALKSRSRLLGDVEQASIMRGEAVKVLLPGSVADLSDVVAPRTPSLAQGGSVVDNLLERLQGSGPSFSRKPTIRRHVTMSVLRTTHDSVPGAGPSTTASPLSPGEPLLDRVGGAGGAAGPKRPSSPLVMLAPRTPSPNVSSGGGFSSMSTPLAGGASGSLAARLPTALSSLRSASQARLPALPSAVSGAGPWAGVCMPPLVVSDSAALESPDSGASSSSLPAAPRGGISGRRASMTAILPPSAGLVGISRAGSSLGQSSAEYFPLSNTGPLSAVRAGSGSLPPMLLKVNSVTPLVVPEATGWSDAADLVQVSRDSLDEVPESGRKAFPPSPAPRRAGSRLATESPSSVRTINGLPSSMGGRVSTPLQGQDKAGKVASAAAGMSARGVTETGSRGLMSRIKGWVKRHA